MKKKWMGMIVTLICMMAMCQSVSAEPVEDDQYAFTIDTNSDLSETGNPLLRSVDTSNVTVSAAGQVTSDKNGWNTDYNSVLKYVVSDGNNVDMEGRWRMIYCLQYRKSYPEGTLVWDNQGALSKKITYCLFYGCRYWGQTSVWSNYSTGDWKKDYWATQWAIHILNGEVSLADVVANASVDSNFNSAIAVVHRMVNAANNDKNYSGFTDKYFTDIKFGLDRETVSWSQTDQYHGQTGYVTEWITPQLSDGYSSSMREYVRDLTIHSDADGISVIKEDDRTMSRYRLWMAADTYKSYQSTGRDITTTTTATVPDKFGAWKYSASNPSSQMCTLLEMTAGAEHMTTKIATVKSYIPRIPDRTIAILKVDAADENVSIAGAVMRLSDAAGNVVQEFTSTTEPYVLEHVLPGTYTLTEVTPPPGYGQADPMTITVTAGTEIVYYKMKDLKYCDLTVVKRIPVTDNVEGTIVPNLTWAHGNPTFFFHVEGVDLFGQKHSYVRSVEFTREYVESNTSDGYTELSCTFLHIPQGNGYHIWEQKVARYSLERIDSEDHNIAIEEQAATADLVAKPNGSTVRFTNGKYRWDKLSHNDVVVNKIKLR